jgi:hypothetical protein
MQCPTCKKTIAKTDKFCRFCGEPVVPPPPEPPPRWPREPGAIAIPIENNDFGPGEILASYESPTGSGWGAHIYTGSSEDAHDVKTRPAGCPERMGCRSSPTTRPSFTSWGLACRRSLAHGPLSAAT